MITTKHISIALLTAAAALTLVLLGGALAHADELGFMGEAVFDRLDTNHDGVISPEEAQAARGRMFDKIDADHDGAITAAEIEAAKNGAEKRRARRLATLAGLRAEMPSPSERAAELDQNHDGKVTREEFLTGHSWFDLIAKSGGHITKDEFAKFLDGAH
jgi:Ca2+-binding EF-hand superfamily protein